ncbi:PKD domain containing protein [Kribbella flavida DSM 17836]|uniref:PKD domain containing protein n=1 Tax=Kribbella flavida (strain DSM 17836 / JCM 10339 / NBRC 14399) TaxID=479435 RepID=D2PZ05_KRIFD|nr:PKD domain-containing protein [Kribbella flavida]ADB31799.1 PKD domain containing protein [Kribbella flavida DSM 17836]
MRKPYFCVLMALLTALTGCLVVLAPAANAVQVSQDRLVTDDPANWTPNVLDGSVKTIQQFGNRILIGGEFTQVQSRDGATTYARTNLAAFNATTGEIDATFAPNPDGEVTTIIPAGDGSSAFVAGYFNNISGGGSPSVARIDVTTGARVAGFHFPRIDGRVRDLRLSNGRLWIAGLFSTVEGRPQAGLATVNPATGAYDPFMALQIAGLHNGGVTSVLKIDVTPDGSQLVAIGNFDTIQGVKHHQVFMLNLTGTSATVENWQTNFYNSACSSSFQTYMRDLDIAPDGSYFVISTTGAYGGSLSACDSTARWNTGARGSDLKAKWINNTGGDTTYAVAITGSVVYTGGHARWQNNPFSGDSAGQGAVARPGIAALDPVNGLPLSWNPTRERGVGVFDLLATPAGLWVGSDTDRIGNFEYHAKIAFFPLTGAVIAPNNTPTLPNDLYIAGRRKQQLLSVTWDNTLGRSSFNGTTATAVGSVPNGGLTWGNNRGAFMLNGQLYAGWSNGAFDRRSFDGSTFGAATPVNTGDLLTTMSTWHGEVQNITGMFFDSGRIYYTRSGQSSLFYRYFTPESGVVGANVFTASPSLTGLSFSQVNGMFLAGNTLYWAQSTDGTLRKATWNSATGAPVAGTAQTLSTGGTDWRARTLFLYQDPSGLGPNQVPTAQAAVSCTDLNCTYSSAGSTDPDGTIASYAWTFGDGSTSTAANPSHRYAAAGTYQVGLTVTDNRGGTNSKTQSVTVTHVNAGPTAAFGASCSGSTCAFDGSGASDPDGTIAAYAWTFGDGATGSGVTPSHTYAASGTYSVTLTVTDNEGATASTSRPVTVEASAPIDFVGSSRVNGNAASFAVTVPSGVVAGDALLLFFADNDPAPAITGPAGWTLVESVASSNQVGRLWRRTATAADAGSTVQVTTSSLTKADATLLAYRGTAADPVSGSATGSETVSQAGHTTPTLTTATVGGKLVSYWAEKSSATTALTPPAGTTTRASGTGAGSGRITALAVDSNDPVVPGQVGGLTATADTASARALMFTVVLAPNS